MINKLKKQFVVIASLSVGIMLVVLMIALTIVNFLSMDEKTDVMISFITENGGKLPRPNEVLPPNHNFENIDKEALFDTRFFIVYYDDADEITRTSLGNIYTIAENEASIYAENILSNNIQEGYVDEFKYYNTTLDEENAIIFVEIRRELSIFQSSVKNSFIISLIAMSLTVLIAYLLSNKAVQPIALAYEKQKQFITNASHELKTPLTVISANMDILEMSIGDNKWIKNSTYQISKLTNLVANLTALARLEERGKLLTEVFCLSETVKMSVESFLSVAKNENKIFHFEIDEDIQYIGDEKAIGQLLYIILDNAMKYSDEQGEITLYMKKNQSKVSIILTNTVPYITKGNHSEFFDRFYKNNNYEHASSNRSFGIGLCLAKEIVESHKGEINAYSKHEKVLTVEIKL